MQLRLLGPVERVQYMFRSDPPPAMGRADQFTNSGGPAFLPNVFQGAGDAARSAAGVGTLRETACTSTGWATSPCLQRSSRTADGRPIHVRNDGPGFDSLDVPDGTKQPKLEFMVFVPTAEFFRTMRVNQASLDLQAKFHVTPTDNGLERFITATRRQNFLIPPRRHRAFPFAEFIDDPAKKSPAKSSPASKSSTSSSSSGSGSAAAAPAAAVAAAAPAAAAAPVAAVVPAVAAVTVAAVTAVAVAAVTAAAATRTTGH